MEIPLGSLEDRNPFLVLELHDERILPSCECTAGVNIDIPPTSHSNQAMAAVSDIEYAAMRKRTY